MLELCLKGFGLLLKVVVVILLHIILLLKNEKILRLLITKVQRNSNWEGRVIISWFGLLLLMSQVDLRLGLVLEEEVAGEAWQLLLPSEHSCLLLSELVGSGGLVESIQLLALVGQLTHINVVLRLSSQHLC